MAVSVVPVVASGTYRSKSYEQPVYKTSGVEECRGAG